MIGSDASGPVTEVVNVHTVRDGANECLVRETMRWHIDAFLR